MICLSAKTVTRDDGLVVCIDAEISEEELYDNLPKTLEDIRKILLGGQPFPRKRFQLPATPFLLGIAGESQELLIESVEGWEGNQPGKRFVFYSREVPSDLGLLAGKTLETRPRPVGGKEVLQSVHNK
jgi:hypothetical protein